MKAWGCARIGLAFAVVCLLSPRVAFGDCQANCYLVNTPSDTVNPSCDVSGIGTCSLRDALTKIALSSNNVIQFAIGTGHQKITLLSNLPDIVLPVTIDGTTQPGYAGVPLIEIQRGDAGTATHGLRTRQMNGRLTAKGLVINHFRGVCTAGINCAAIIFSESSDLVRPGGHTVKNCYIGTDATGTSYDGNDVGILDNSQGSNTIGGTTPADRNVISGNAPGISIGLQGAGYSVQSVIQGNYIGLNASGTALVLPSFYGIFTGPPYPGFSPGIVVGGSSPGAGNVIAGNGNAIQMDSGINDIIQGNWIGLDATGLTAFATGAMITLENGIILHGETNATIASNVIVTSGAAITLTYDPLTILPTHGTVVQANYLGTDITGNRALANSGFGISIGGGAPNNTIGGSGTGQGNVIGGFSQGISITTGGFGGGSAGNLILGNRIGIGVNGTPIPNPGPGIEANSTEGNTVIGGENPGEGNIIAFNGTNVPGSYAPGVIVQLGSGNRISGNSIYGNTGLGIDLGADGVTPNDSCDADTGPNNLQNFPVITAVTPGSSTRVQGTLNSVANTMYRLEFFANATCDPRGYGQGQAFIGYLDVTTDNNCNATFDVTYLYATLSGQSITATATDPSGNTSEFSACHIIALNFYTLPPCRVIDTRNPAGPYGGPALAPTADRTFVLTGQCGIPSTALAASINVTITQPTAAGDLRLYPGGTPLPLVSTINYRPGQTRANNAIVTLGSGGDIGVHCDQASGTVQFILDVNGYFQ